MITFPAYVAALEALLGEPVSAFDYTEVISDAEGVEHRLMPALPSVRIFFDLHEPLSEIADALRLTREAIKAEG